MCACLMRASPVSDAVVSVRRKTRASPFLSKNYSQPLYYVCAHTSARTRDRSPFATASRAMQQTCARRRVRRGPVLCVASACTHTHTHTAVARVRLQARARRDVIDFDVRLSNSLFGPNYARAGARAHGACVCVCACACAPVHSRRAATQCVR